jgi:hypothetical protein
MNNASLFVISESEKEFTAIINHFTFSLEGVYFVDIQPANSMGYATRCRQPKRFVLQGLYSKWFNNSNTKLGQQECDQTST